MALQLAVGAAVVLVARRAPRRRHVSWVRRAVALVTGAIAAGIGVRSARSLGPALTVFPRPRPHVPLADGGAYRIVRHPMYTSALGLATAVATVGSPWAFGPTGLLAVVLDRKAAREEAWLLESLPEYASYRARVRWRFLPGVR